MVNKIKENDYIEISETLRYISTVASRKVIDIYNNSNNYDIKLKNDTSPLTEADLESNRIIIDNIQKNFKNIPIISEENTNSTLDSKIFFLVDPLDGTKEFISRNGEFTVNIALIVNNYPTLGVVDIPAKKIQFFSDGKKSFKSSDGLTQQIKVKKIRKIVKILASRSHMNNKTENFIKKFKNHKLFKKGSSLKICSIAEGNADLYPRFGNTMEWDIAAAHAILKTAGGRLTDLKLNEIKYGKKNLLNKKFLAFSNFKEDFLLNKIYD